MKILSNGFPGKIGINKGSYDLEHTDEYVHLQFDKPHRVLSSAVLNGGLCEGEHILNLKVPLKTENIDHPADTIRLFAEDSGWREKTVGMMTAADMSTFVHRQENTDKTEVSVMVTSGLSNARRAGDKADSIQTPGTINIILYISGVLSGAAMVEALIIVAEAKAAALSELQIKSPVSGRTATGTGTDAAAVVSGFGPDSFDYCGKHVVMGEIIGRLVLAAVKESVVIAQKLRPLGQ